MLAIPPAMTLVLTRPSSRAPANSKMAAICTAKDNLSKFDHKNTGKIHNVLIVYEELHQALKMACTLAAQQLLGAGHTIISQIMHGI